VIICLERHADLHIAQLMPLPLTVSCFSKIQIGFAFLVPAHLGSPGQRAVKRVCVCVCVCVCTGSERLHRYCHLANDFGSRRIFIFLNRLGHRGMSTELSLSPARSGSPPKTWFPGSTRVQISKGISIGSSILYGSRVCLTHTQTQACTDHARTSVTTARIAALCASNASATWQSQTADSAPGVATWEV